MTFHWNSETIREIKKNRKQKTRRTRSSDYIRGIKLCIATYWRRKTNRRTMASVLLEARPYRPFKSSEEYLYAMREDLAEWLNTLYPTLMINVDNFMDRLDTGIALCKVRILWRILIDFCIVCLPRLNRKNEISKILRVVWGQKRLGKSHKNEDKLKNILGNSSKILSNRSDTNATSLGAFAFPSSNKSSVSKKHVCDPVDVRRGFTKTCPTTSPQ